MPTTIKPTANIAAALVFIVTLLTICTVLLAADEPIEHQLMTMTWNHPTNRTDSSKLPITELSHTILKWSCNGKTGTHRVKAPKNELVITRVQDKQTCVYTVKAVDKKGVESAWSKELSVTGPFKQPVKPEPPTWYNDLVDWMREHYQAAE